MQEERLTERGEKIREIATALGLGQLEAILSKRAEIMALRPEELDRVATLLKATKAAGNDCCTGG